MSRLDEGGMSTVYEARHVESGAAVAVKVLLPDLAASPTDSERLRTEAEYLGRVRHPNVVALLDTWEPESGERCLVFERLEGETLHDRLRRGSLSLDECVGITVQIAAALSAAHAQGIVHRDVKPANVFLAEGADGALFAKLIDFGISKDLRSACFVSEEGTLIGTPGYMAPEQACGWNDEIDERTDQFSLALLVYEMLTGERPFASATLAETLRRVVTYEPSAISLHAFGVPAAVDAVVARGMCKSKEGRWWDIGEFARCLVEASRRADFAFWEAPGFEGRIAVAENDTATQDKELARLEPDCPVERRTERERVETMNWDQIQGEWRQVKGLLKSKWGKLTDDDLTVVEGKRDALVGRLQVRYGLLKDEAEKKLDEWLETMPPPSKNKR
jgi:serine/threonine protein kinase/uncharacterized protein YjbJ (UPF0337 family)